MRCGRNGGIAGVRTVKRLAHRNNEVDGAGELVNHAVQAKRKRGEGGVEQGFTILQAQRQLD